VKLTARVVRGAAPDGYRDTREFAAPNALTPAFAPTAFALRLDELELE
jgi:hypothetical protein